jgi:hypothetical protein
MRRTALFLLSIVASVLGAVTPFASSAHAVMNHNETFLQNVPTTNCSR